jgi:glycerol dehydrogenase-like iron-containing ADH family enzyme
MGHLSDMAEREKREQIPTEYTEEQTQNILRRQDQVQGQRRDKTVSDFPQAAALAQVLKDLDFPADKGAIIRFVEQSNRPERNEVLPLVQRINERQYQNVSEVAEATRLVHPR